LSAPGEQVSTLAGFLRRLCSTKALF
jgi:hypothetical protein